MESMSIQQVGPGQPPAKKENILPIISIGLAAMSWITQTHFFTSIPAIVIGIVALVKIRREPEKHDVHSGRILSYAGIGIGCLNVGFIVLAVLLGIAFAVLDIVTGGL
jgi:hypothetical protein